MDFEPDMKRPMYEQIAAALQPRIMQSLLDTEFIVDQSEAKAYSEMWGHFFIKVAPDLSFFLGETEEEDETPIMIAHHCAQMAIYREIKWPVMCFPVAFLRTVPI